MKKLLTYCAMALSLAASPALAEVKTGSAAPDFTATDSISGKTFSLADFKGKHVVLEWTNFGCPFVKKYYSKGDMQQLQHAAAKDGVVWITINSSAKGMEGHLADDAAAKQALTERKASPAHFVRDETGAIGKPYAAKTTPHMYVIDTKGTLVYQGAIDSKPSAAQSDIANATNYVSQALAELKAGKPVSVPSTQPYGCSVKYAN